MTVLIRLFSNLNTVHRIHNMTQINIGNILPNGAPLKRPKHAGSTLCGLAVFLARSPSEPGGLTLNSQTLNNSTTKVHNKKHKKAL